MKNHSKNISVIVSYPKPNNIVSFENTYNFFLRSAETSSIPVFCIIFSSALILINFYLKRALTLCQ